MTDRISFEISNALSRILEEGYKPIAIMLYGSQNYGLQSEDSDYDFKAIIVPTFEDIVHGRKLVSTTIELNDGLCDIKDIRSMMSCWRKQNVNFVELLFTKWKWIDPEYRDILSPLFENAEKIVHYDENHALKCIKGMQMEKYHALFKLYPAQKEVIEKYGYAAKQLSHILRLEDLVNKYISGASYPECLTPSKEIAKQLIDIKTYKTLFNDMEKVKKCAEKSMERVNKLIEEYKFNPIDKEIEELMDNVNANVIRCALRNEIMKG